MDNDTLTTSQVATELGCSVRTVQRHARKNSIGTRVTPQLTVFSRQDVEKLRELVRPTPGNPLMGSSQPETYRRTISKKS